MIKSQELRLGNWVELRGEFLQVYSINNKSTPSHERIEITLDSSVLDKHINGVNIRCIEDIPLTEEILLKCGFDNDIKHLYSLKADDEFYVKYNINNKGFYLVLNGFYVIRINHLHQLQNLFYTLTGEELQINL